MTPNQVTPMIDWQKEFDKKYSDEFYWDSPKGDWIHEPKSHLKDFIRHLLASAVSRERGLVYKEIREKMSHLPVYHTLDDDEPELVALLSMEDILSDLLTPTDTIIK